MTFSLSRYWRAARLPFGMAFGLSAYATILDRATDGAAIAKYGVQLRDILFIYFGSAALAGLVILLFGQWATSRARATLLGLLAGMLLAVVFNYTLSPKVIGTVLTGWKLFAYMVLIGLFPGAFLAALYWERPQPRQPVADRGHE